MCKKFAAVAAAILAGFVVLQWTGLNSYTSTAWGKIRGQVKSSVPLEFEIERVRNEVAQLVPDMKKNFSIIAEEMVAVENLQKEIAVTRGNMEKQRQNILTMKEDLKKGTTTIVYDGRPYSADRVREKLERDYATFKVAEAELRTREQLLEAKERSLEAAREQLASLKAQKQELEIQVAQLEAELKTVRLAQTKNKVHFDDSQLARCKETLAEIRNRLNVERKTSELEATYTSDPIPVEKKAKSSNELIKEIESHLGSETGSKVAVD